MAVDVEELIITPFKEVVERGQDAVTNAQAAEEDDPEMGTQMARAAQALVKEGDRALKRLQPIWDAHVDKFGDAFKDAIRDSDEIAEKRRVLEDLLYDFEDYIELDSFDLDKFVELQAATKSFALHALNIVKRLKVEAPVLRADGKSSGLDVLGDEFDRVRIVSEPRRLSPPAPSSSPRISEWVTDQTSEPHPGVRRYIAGDRPPEHAGMAKVATRVNVEPPVIHSRTYRNGYTYGSPVDNTGYTSATSVFDPTSPSTTNRTSLFSEPNTSSAGPSPCINPNSEPRGASHGTFYSESDHMAPLMLPPLSEHDDGLMLADETRTVRSETSGTQIRTISTGARETACQIGPKSSFHQLKGFCDGAELFKKSEHARGMKQASIYGQLVAVGRCTSCEFYLVHSEMTRDLERDSRANFMKFNVVYRLRFMFKSHMTTKNLTEPLSPRNSSFVICRNIHNLCLRFLE
ncbi:hypothetical protein ACHAP6_006052 [Verticillium nonalfalfae]